MDKDLVPIDSSPSVGTLLAELTEDQQRFLVARPGYRTDKECARALGFNEDTPRMHWTGIPAFKEAKALLIAEALESRRSYIKNHNPAIKAHQKIIALADLPITDSPSDKRELLAANREILNIEGIRGEAREFGSGYHDNRKIINITNLYQYLQEHPDEDKED